MDNDNKKSMINEIKEIRERMREMCNEIEKEEEGTDSDDIADIPIARPKPQPVRRKKIDIGFLSKYT